MSPSVSNQAILITGGAKHIGRTLALHMAKQGYDIMIHCHQSLDEARQTKEDILALGQDADIISADLSDTTSYQTIIEKTFHRFPHIAHMVNNASIFAPLSFAETTLAEYQRFHSINVTAPFFLAQSFCQQMQQRSDHHGTITNITDAQTSHLVQHHFMYMFSKHSLQQLSTMLAGICGPSIRVNAIAPGIIDVADNANSDFAKDKKSQVPLQSLATPESVAHALSYLIRNPHVTGQTLFIDSGDHLL